jgi:hypothetical protein
MLWMIRWKKKFDETFEIPRLYIAACTYSVQYVRLYPILMSMLFHHYRQLGEGIEQVEQIGAKVDRCWHKGASTV